MTQHETDDPLVVDDELEGSETGGDAPDDVQRAKRLAEKIEEDREDAPREEEPGTGDQA